MDITEVLGSEDMMVQEMTTSTLILPEPARGAGGAGAGAGAGGAGGGSGELGRRLLVAARHGDTPLVLDLMAKGAPFTTDWLGTSALHVAARGAHADTCAVLLRAGVSRDCRTKVERTPLHLAAAGGHAGVVALLLRHGAAVDCRDMLRMTPLHWAAERGHADVARLLLEEGADPHARSKFEKTPLDLAARRRDPALRSLLEDAARAREAADSARALHRATAGAAETDSQSDLDLDGSQESKREPKPEPIKINIEKPLESMSSGAAAAMLRRHGIALLPRDEGCTVLSALQSGRSVVLSDAGKLMLKESGDLPPPVAPPTAPPAGPPSKGVLLTATPVKSPPRPGVKIFTLNNKLLAMPKENKAPIKKVINPHDSKQIQFIKLPSDAKIAPSRSIPMKAKNKLPSPRPPSAPSPCPPSPQVAPLARPTVKLVMQRSAQNKLTTSDNGMETSVPAERDVLFVPEEFLTNSSSRYLRTQLLGAHRTIAALSAQLHDCRTRLARYEDV